MDLISGDALAVATIRAEADNQPVEGKIAIGAVIRNRMRHRYFSDGTIHGTVLAPAQFSCFNTFAKARHIYLRLQVEDKLTMEAVKAWETSAMVDPVDGAVLYFNPALASPQWDFTKLEEVRAIGDHTFYRDKGVS